MSRSWNRDEEILAFVLYCKVSFGQIHARNPQIVRLAQLLDRTPASVSMKIANFGRFDPALQERGIKGLSNGSKLDEQVWNEFHHNWGGLIEEHQEIIEKYTSKSQATLKKDSSQIFPKGYHRLTEVKQRVNQDFFRESLLITYNGKCCVTGMSIPVLLIASHIKPWSVSDPKTERLSPSNGLLLNAFHDKAFDRGLITIDTNYSIRVSSRVRDYEPKEVCENWLLSYEGKRIMLPEKFLPDRSFIEYHNDEVFVH